MKKILSKFKKYTFWVAFVGVLVLFLQNLAKALGYEIDTTNIESAIMSFCGVLVVLGVVTKDSTNTTNVDAKPNSEPDSLANPKLNIIPEVSEIKQTTSLLLSDSNETRRVECYDAREESECLVDRLERLATNNETTETQQCDIDEYVVVENISTVADFPETQIVGAEPNQTLDDVKKVESDERIIQNENISQVFRDENSDQIASPNTDKTDTQNSAEYVEFCKFAELCPDCPFRQKFESVVGEPNDCDNEQSVDAQSSTTDSACTDMPEINKTQKINFDPTYSPIE